MLDPKLPNRLLSLLRSGFVQDKDGLLVSLLRGVTHPCRNKDIPGWVASRVLLVQRETLSSDNELVMVLIAIHPELREPWLRILAARCKEAGQMAVESLLLDLVSQLKGAALWVEEQLSHASMASTPTATLERELLGISAEQAAATPMLTRILAAAFELHKAQSQELTPLPTIDSSGVQADQNWVEGRLIALPGYKADPEYILSDAEENRIDSDSMTWVLANPWALLLAMVNYAQDVWAAEARGGLLLELPNGHNAFHPSEIVVLVQGPEGDETRCGTLSELLFRVLGHLDMYCFPHQPRSDELNVLLAPLIGQLLERHVWRYRDGTSGNDGQFQIHPAFADACYRIAGSKVFNRTGKHLWQAVRIQAEQWRNELRPTVAKGAL